MTLDGAEGYEIVGVAPPNLNFPSRSDLFRSSGINANPASYESRDRRYLSLVARLQPRVSYAQAQDGLDRLASRLEREFPASNAGIRFRATPLRDLYVGNVRPYLLLLLGGVAFVLLLACTNVANLLLAKAIGRQRDLAVRSALGASRATLVSQMLLESSLLAGAGAIAGIGVAAAAIRLLTTVVDLRLPAWMTIGLDWRVLTALAAAAAIAALASGLLPALRLSRPELASDLKESARGASASASHQRVRQALVVGEVAIAALLLVGAGLMVQTVRQLQRVDLGFAPERVMTFRVELGWRAYDTLTKSVNFYTQTLDTLRRRGDVESVALDSNLPHSGKPRDPNQIVIEGQAADEFARNPFVNRHWISPGLFATLRVPLVAGRVFTDECTNGDRGRRRAASSTSSARSSRPSHRSLGRSSSTARSPDRGPAATPSTSSRRSGSTRRRTSPG
jgi:putative ABC transport system permease protein